MKKSMFVILVLSLIIALACGPAFAKKPKLIIRIPNVLPAKENISQAWDKFGQLVEKKSNGGIKVNIFHGAQLGPDYENYEACRAGFLEAATGSYSNISKLTPAFAPFHLPYIFESRNQFLRALDSKKVRARADQALEKIGLKWLMTVEAGTRQIQTTKKKVLTPDDMNGLKLRASRSPLEISAINSFGATAQTIDWPEVYDALKNGMVDGMTVTFSATWAAKHHENVRYIGELNFQAYAFPMLFNKKWWDKRTPETQAILIEAAREAEKWHRSILLDQANANIADMQRQGVDIYRLSPEQLQLFKDKAKNVWTKYSGTLAPKDYVDLIISEMGPPGDDGWGHIIK